VYDSGRSRTINIVVPDGFRGLFVIAGHKDGIAISPKSDQITYHIPADGDYREATPAGDWRLGDIPPEYL